MIDRPVRVYLDAQDYINFFIDREKGHDSPVLDELLALKESGVAEFGYSFLTIVEFITKPPDSFAEERRRRGELVSLLCDRNAFPYLTDLANGSEFPNGGLWMPVAVSEIITIRKLRSLIAEGLPGELTRVSQELNRADRRKLKSQATVRNILRDAYRKNALGSIPLSSEIVKSNAIGKALAGKLSEVSVDEMLRRWMFDPAAFADIYYLYSGNRNYVDEHLKAASTALESAAEKIVDAMMPIREYEKNRLAQRKAAIESGVDEKTAKRLTPAFQPQSIEFSDERVDRMVGSGRAGHFSHYLNAVMSGAYAAKPSDMLDLMHLVYANDCDLFRCDKGMTSVFSNYCRLRHKLVGRISELPDRIREIANLA